MKTPLIGLVVLCGAGLVFGTAGCVSHETRTLAPAQSAQPTVALEVTVEGLPPTPGQFQYIRAQYQAMLAKKGWLLVDDPADADRIIRVNFVPDPTDPEHKGMIYTVAILENTGGANYASAYNPPSYYYTDYYFPDGFYWDPYYFGMGYGFGYGYGYGRHHHVGGGGGGGTGGGTPKPPKPPTTVTGEPDEHPRIPRNKWHMRDEPGTRPPETPRTVHPSFASDSYRAVERSYPDRSSLPSYSERSYPDRSYSSGSSYSGSSSYSAPAPSYSPSPSYSASSDSGFSSAGPSGGGSGGASSDAHSGGTRVERQD